jgi:hypothetical protein
MESTNNAGAYLTPLDPGETYFATILCAISTSNNFSLQTTAATGLLISRFQAPISTRVKGTSGALIEAVKQYHNLRINLAYYATAQSPYALPVVQKIKYTE